VFPARWWPYWVPDAGDSGPCGPYGKCVKGPVKNPEGEVGADGGWVCVYSSGSSRNGSTLDGGQKN
jgi:hypothetical protein